MLRYCLAMRARFSAVVSCSAKLSKVEVERSSSSGSESEETSESELGSPAVMERAKARALRLDIMLLASMVLCEILKVHKHA